MILDIWTHLSNADTLLVMLCLVAIMALCYGWTVEGI
jgi:hypothetical protein